MLKTIKKVLGFEEVAPTNSDIIQGTREKINGALATFFVLEEEITGSIQTLEGVVVNSQEAIKKHEEDIVSANTEMVAQQVLLNKVQQFIS